LGGRWLETTAGHGMAGLYLLDRIRLKADQRALTLTMSVYGVHMGMPLPAARDGPSDPFSSPSPPPAADSGGGGGRGAQPPQAGSSNAGPAFRQKKHALGRLAAKM